MKHLIVVVLLMVLTPAYAAPVDGKVKINQFLVDATGGFPYTITHPGSYKLSGNLVIPNGVHGFDIDADDVTIDLDGFSITGAGINVSGSFAFVGVDRRRIRIMNGTMSKTYGFAFRGTSQYITIERISLDSTLFAADGSPVTGVAALIGQNAESYSVIRGFQATGAVALTCPGLVIDSTATVFSERTVPDDGTDYRLGTRCTRVNVF